MTEEQCEAKSQTSVTFAAVGLLHSKDEKNVGKSQSLIFYFSMVLSLHNDSNSHYSNDNLLNAHSVLCLPCAKTLYLENLIYFSQQSYKIRTHYSDFAGEGTET